MNYPGAYSGQTPGAPSQGAPQGGYPGSQPYPGAAQQYGAPPPQQYGAPPAQQYGAPPAQQYGAPPAQQYGAPPAQQYGAPPAQQYGAPSAQQYGAPPAQQYGGSPGYPQQPGGVSPEVMSWFRAVDQDNSGYINAVELSRALQSGNSRNFSVQACATMIGMFDHQHTGRINMQQFGQLYGFINQWTDAFKRADSDNSGSISVGEMIPVLQQQGYNVSPATVNMLIAKYGEGTPSGPATSLGLDGFILANVMLRRLTDAFRQKDTQQKAQITVSYEDFINMVVGTL